MNEDVPMAPATGFDLRAVPLLKAVTLTVHYLVSPMERKEGAHASPNFLLHTAQLRELAQAMLRAADQGREAA